MISYHSIELPVSFFPKTVTHNYLLVFSLHRLSFHHQSVPGPYKLHQMHLLLAFLGG